MATNDSAPDRDQLLLELKESLQTALSQIQSDQLSVENLKSNVKQLQTDLSDLEKSSSDVDKTVEAYKAAYPQISDQIDGLEQYVANKQTVIDAVVSQELRAKVDAEIDEVDEQIADLEDAIHSLEAIYHLELVEGEADDETRTAGEEDVMPVQAAEIAHQNALSGPDGLEQRQALYEQLAKSLDQAKGRLTALTDLKKAVETAEDQNNYLNMYFYFAELRDNLAALQQWLKAPEELATALEAAWVDLLTGKETLRTAMDQLNLSKGHLKTYRESRDAMVKNRKQTILDAIAVLE